MKHKLFKLISLILIAAIAWPRPLERTRRDRQDVVWACPEYSRGAHPDALRPRAAAEKNLASTNTAERFRENKYRELSGRIVAEANLTEVTTQAGAMPTYTQEYKYGTGYCPVEKWGIGSDALFIRVGHLFFIEEDVYENLSGKLKKAVGANAIRVRSFDRMGKDISFTYNHYTILAIIAMINSDISGKRIIDAGAGDGILSLAALRLGATSVDLVDRLRMELNKANQQLEINGYIAGADFRTHCVDLKDKPALAAAIPKVPQQTAIVSNIGNLGGLNGVTNADSMELIRIIPNTVLFIAGGNFETQDQQEEVVERDERLISQYGFEAIPETAMVRLTYPHRPTEFLTCWVGRLKSSATGLLEKPMPKTIEEEIVSQI